MGSAVVRLSAERASLLRLHARFTSPAARSGRHEAWGVCDCDTAKRLRSVAVALANIHTPAAKGGA